MDTPITTSDIADLAETALDATTSVAAPLINDGLGRLSSSNRKTMIYIALAISLVGGAVTLLKRRSSASEQQRKSDSTKTNSAPSSDQRPISLERRPPVNT